MALTSAGTIFATLMTLAAHGARGREGDVAGDDRDVAACDFAGLVKAAGGLFDADDIVDLGQSGHGLGCQTGSASAGDVVQDDRQIDLIGDGLEVLIESLLRGLVVVGAHLKRGVGADFLGIGGQLDTGRLLSRPRQSPAARRPLTTPDHRCRG
jgi:hypothetical protein